MMVLFKEAEKAVFELENMVINSVSYIAFENLFWTSRCKPTGIWNME